MFNVIFLSLHLFHKQTLLHSLYQKKKLFERKKEKEVKNSSRHKFKSIYIFSDLETEKNGEFLTITSDLGNTLTARKINMVYGGGI